MIDELITVDDILTKFIPIAREESEGTDEVPKYLDAIEKILQQLKELPTEIEKLEVVFVGTCPDGCCTEAYIEKEKALELLNKIIGNEND